MIFQDGIGLVVRPDGIGICHVRGSLSGPRKVVGRFHAQDADLSIAERLQAASALLADFIKERKIGATDIFIGIPNDRVMFRVVELPAVVKENLSATLAYEMEKYVPLPVSEIYFDHAVLEENKANNRIKVLLTVIKKQDFDPYLEWCRQSNGGFCGMEPFAVATVNALAWLGVESKGEAIRQALTDEHQVANLFEAMDPKKRDNANVTAVEDLSGFALGTKPIAEMPFRINLLPLENRKRPSRLKYYLLIGLAALMLLSGIAWAGSAVLRQRLTLRAIDAEIERLAAEIDKTEKMRKEIAEAMENLSRLSSLRQGRVAMIDVLKELTRVVPSTAWVRQFNVSGDDIVLEGVAEKASDLIPLLEASPLFKDALFQSAITKETDGKEKFRIGLTLVSEG